jgi:hypothetical protein
MRICLDTPNLVKMAQTYPALYFDTSVSFVSLEVIYLAQLHRQRTAMPYHGSAFNIYYIVGSTHI